MVRPQFTTLATDAGSKYGASVVWIRSVFSMQGAYFSPNHDFRSPMHVATDFGLSQASQT